MVHSLHRPSPMRRAREYLPIRPHRGMTAFTFFGMKLIPSLRFFGNTGAVAGTFTVVGIVVGLILLTIFLCCRRHRRNKQPPLQAQDSDVSLTQMHDNPFADDPFASFGPSDSVRTAEHQYRWERRSSFDATDEQAMGYVESTSSTHGFNVQRNDVGDNVIYETRNPRLAGINPGIVVNYRDQNPEDPFSDRPVYQSMPRQASYGKGPTAINHFSAVTPPQAHLPFPNWRRVSETPSSPSVYATSLPAAEDSESQPSTPTSFTFRKPTTVPSQSYNWGASAKKPSSYGIPVIPEAYITPPNSDDGRDTPVQRERQSGEHQYTPPSIPPKSPLRTAMSMRTLLNVSSPLLTSLPCPSAA